MVAVLIPNPNLQTRRPGFPDVVEEKLETKNSVAMPGMGLGGGTKERAVLAWTQRRQQIRQDLLVHRFSMHLAVT